jgi:hypothetical protein
MKRGYLPLNYGNNEFLKACLGAGSKTIKKGAEFVSAFLVLAV